MMCRLPILPQRMRASVCSLVYVDIWGVFALESKRGHMHVPSNHNLRASQVGSLDDFSREQTHRCSTDGVQLLP